ncbi:DUF4809 family protein [Enterococcus pingfangensis]|uniref:DUF4809 family protein n=1 Tax=Enterococcus pingfangensis TaxID=2559924 RepID=UPI0010F78BF9|nr:DUF4809 family protein [Enterococcus pingfangensis]
MAKAAISSSAFLVDGGCNACKMQNTETFTIHFEDRLSEVLDNFDVPSLVQTLAQKNGWRETVIPTGIGEETLVLKKGSDMIEPKRLGDQIVYQAAAQRIQTKQTFEDNDQLFDQVNQILAQLFKIEPYEIKLAVD